MAYSKLYSSIVHSSLWTESDHIRLLFITMLAIADREGYVYASKNGLYRLANLDLDQCDEDDPLEALMMPDGDSSDLLRNPENEGKRVEAVPGGFRILNFLYYRGLRNEDDRRAQNREAQKRHREKVSKVSGNNPKSASVSQGQTIPSASASASVSVSEVLKKESVRDKFEEWMVLRKGMGKAPKNWEKMFSEQAKWLNGFSTSDQMEILSQSIRNNWQGLHEPKGKSHAPELYREQGTQNFNSHFKPEPTLKDLTPEQIAKNKQFASEMVRKVKHGSLH